MKEDSPPSVLLLLLKRKTALSAVEWAAFQWIGSGNSSCKT